MGMTKPKKQHYVPQFLLRRFCSSRRKAGKIWVLDKKKAAVFPASVRDVAHENSFYEYHDDEVDVELEGLMQNIDSIGSRIISKIIESGEITCEPRDRVWLSYFVATQMVRTPVTRNEMENMRQLLIYKWGEDLRVHPDDPKTLGEYKPNDSKLPSLQMINHVPEFVAKEA